MQSLNEIDDGKETEEGGRKDKHLEETSQGNGGEMTVEED